MHAEENNNITHGGRKTVFLLYMK